MNISRPVLGWTTLSRQVAVGGMMWAIGATVTQPGWAPTLLLLAAFVLFPLGLDLIDPPRGAASGWWLLACGAPLWLSFALQRGDLAAALALPWLLAMAWLSLQGVLRLRQRIGVAREWGVAAALVFPLVGATWLVFSRRGLRPLDLSDPLVQATALHFHYAGFALPLIAGLLASRSRAGAIALAGVLLGVPLVAAGITGTALGFRDLEAPAAWFLATACLLVGVLQWREALRQPGWSRGLRIASSLALIIGMGFAAAYALGQRIGAEWLDIPWMVRTHGTLNAVGFALLGLVGWHLGDE